MKRSSRPLAQCEASPREQARLSPTGLGVPVCCCGAPLGYSGSIFGSLSIISVSYAQSSTPTSGTINPSSVAVHWNLIAPVRRGAPRTPERALWCGIGRRSAQRAEFRTARDSWNRHQRTSWHPQESCSGTGYEHDHPSDLFWRSQPFQRVSLNDCSEKLRLTKAHPIPTSTGGKVSPGETVFTQTVGRRHKARDFM